MRPYRSGAPLPLCLIFMLCVTFLAPLYHSHDHNGDHHQGNGDDHPVLHDVSVYEDLSAGEQHSGSHLHIKKDIGRTDTRLTFLNGKSHHPGLVGVIESSVLAEPLTCRRAKHTHVFVFPSTPCAHHSGLSPPVV